MKRRHLQNTKLAKRRPDVFQRNAAELRRLYQRIKDEAARQPAGPGYHAACAEFHQRYDALAFPGGWRAAQEKLRRGDAETVETAIRFLESDPYFHRSGYMKEKIIPRLKHVALTREQRDRLGRLIIESVETPWRREYRQYARLAGVLQLPTIARAMEQRTHCPRDLTRRRALHVLEIMAMRRPDRPD